MCLIFGMTFSSVGHPRPGSLPAWTEFTPEPRKRPAVADSELSEVISGRRAPRSGGRAKRPGRRKRGSLMAGGDATVRPYLSPTLVLLALDWPDGRLRPSFLGFAIRRAPGFSKGEKQGYLFNKIGFIPLGPDSHPMPSNVAPIQKFLWWDSAIDTEDRGKSFAYTVVPVLGTGPNDLQLQEQAAQTVS